MNPVDEAEREESRCAVRALTGLRRVQSCGHSGGFGRRGVCPDCGTTESEL